MRRSIVVIAAALSLAAGSASAAELLTNGGFDDIGAGALPEGWGGLTYYTDGAHRGHVPLPGWTVESGSVDLTQTTSLWGPANTGQYSPDINGWDAGTISQSFATLAGKTYTVSYAYSRNAANAPNSASDSVVAGGLTQAITAPYDRRCSVVPTP